MGSGASTSGPSPVNPRVEHAMDVAGKAKKAHLIDAPTLIDVGHGTIRYRYVPETISNPGNEVTATDDTLLGVKKGYFYHAKLKDYSSETDEMRKHDYKFKYVYREPNAHKGKRLFFVTKKLDRENNSSQSYPSSSKLDTSLLSHNQATVVSFSLELVDESRAPSRLDSPKVNEGLHHPVMLRLSSSEVLETVKEQLSLVLLVPASSLRCYYRNEQVVSDVKLSALFEFEEQDSDITVLATKI